MTWTPPTVKWKTNRFPSPTCDCIRRDRFDGLAASRGEPHPHFPAGFEFVCAAHDDGTVPVGMIQDFQGEWLPFAVWEAWEACVYSYFVAHEIQERTDIADAEKAQMVAGQVLRSSIRSAGIPNLHRPLEDDGPWKPRDQLVAVLPEQAQAVARVRGWNLAEDRIKERVKEEAAQERGVELTEMDWWFEGQLGDRVLHFDTLGGLSTPQRNRVADTVELGFGAGRLIWEG